MFLCYFVRYYQLTQDIHVLQDPIVAPGVRPFSILFLSAYCPRPDSSMVSTTVLAEKNVGPKSIPVDTTTPLSIFFLTVYSGSSSILLSSCAPYTTSHLYTFDSFLLFYNYPPAPSVVSLTFLRLGLAKSSSWTTATSWPWEFCSLCSSTPCVRCYHSSRVVKLS